MILPSQKFVFVGVFFWGATKKPRLANTGKNYRTCNRPNETWKTVEKKVTELGVKGRADSDGYMGDSNAVQSTIRWRAQVRSSKTIKIRQLSMIVSILRDWYKVFSSHFFFFF